MRTRDEIDIYDEDLSTVEAAEFAQVEPGVVRQWARRGHLPKASVDGRGWPLYKALDVAKAEARTRRNGLRIRGSLT